MKTLGLYRTFLSISLFLVITTSSYFIFKVPIDILLIKFEYLADNRNIFLPTSSKILKQTENVSLGVYTPDLEATKYMSIVKFEDLVGHKMKYVLIFKSWGDIDNRFPINDFPYINSLNLTPIITWEPWIRNFANPDKLQTDYSLDSIVNGRHDSYITQWAEEALAMNTPIIIRFAHEMNTPIGSQIWYPWQGDPVKYKLAFQHIVSIFRSLKVNNVKFMWNPIIYDGGDSIQNYYPGNNLVDYIGLTAINLGETTGLKGSIYHWVNCDYLVDHQYSEVSSFNKPVIIAELLSSDIGGSKADWYTECLKRITNHPGIIGMISVQTQKDEFEFTDLNIDWRVDSSDESLKSFRKGTEKGYK